MGRFGQEKGKVPSYTKGSHTLVKVLGKTLKILLLNSFKFLNIDLKIRVVSTRPISQK